MYIYKYICMHTNAQNSLFHSKHCRQLVDSFIAILLCQWEHQEDSAHQEKQLSKNTQLLLEMTSCKS